MAQAPETLTGGNKNTAELRHRAEESAAGLHALMAAAERAAQSVVTGEHAQRKPGMGEKFWQFREYDPGDRPQDIDWRQSAKGDRLYVRQKEWQSTQTTLFWCQNDAAMDYRAAPSAPAKADIARTLSLAAAILMTRGGEQVRMLEGAKRAGRTDLVLHKIGEALLSQKTKELPAAETVSFPQNSFMVLTGDFLAPIEETEQCFSAMAEKADGALIVQVLDPAELTLPFDGRVIFEDYSDNPAITIDNVSSVRADYIRLIEAHREKIKALCKKHRWGYILHTTDMDIRASLFDIWHMLAPERFNG